MENDKTVAFSTKSSRKNVSKHCKSEVALQDLCPYSKAQIDPPKCFWVRDLFPPDPNESMRAAQNEGLPKRKKITVYYLSGFRGSHIRLPGPKNVPRSKLHLLPGARTLTP